MSTMPPNPWHARAPELADWALARFFVRRDRYGGYYRDRETGETCKTSRPKDGALANVVSRSLLLRHFRARGPEDVVGAYLLTPEPSVGRCLAVDIDAHDDSADADANARLGVELYGLLVQMGFRPLLARWGGSCHLYALFADDVPGAALHAFGRSLVGNRQIETFPKQASVSRDSFGNWLRVVGRHHTREEWAEVFDGSQWLSGAPAVAHVLSLTGDQVEIPAPTVAPPESSDPSSLVGGGPPRRYSEVDVLAEYSRSVTLDEVVSWHERAGHRVTRRRPDRVEFVRAGKKAGESFNVMVFGEIPITYNFSTAAGLPDGKGLNPAQVRCFYEQGSCDAQALCRFADGLRAALGLPPRRGRPSRLSEGAQPTGTAEDRVAVLEAHVRELGEAILDLRRQVAFLKRTAHNVNQ